MIMTATHKFPTQASQFNKHELVGSRSYLYIDMEAALLLPQIEITTHKQSQQQIILLKVVIINLFLVGE